MPMILPTDTAHIRLESRQYELFNRPLGQGISRRKLVISSVAGALWLLVMLLAGISLLTGFGPSLYLVPPFVAVHVGTRVDDSGRMALLRWYDAVLARLPRRRVVIRNPLMDTTRHIPQILRVAMSTELHPGPSRRATAARPAQESS